MLDQAEALGDISFRPLEETDLPTVHDWRNQDFVRRWHGGKEQSIEDIRHHYEPRISGDEPAFCFIVLLDESPVGLIETFHTADYPDYQEVIGLWEEAAGLDLFIGERAALKSGLAARIIRQFVETLVFNLFEVETCLMGPHPDNRALIGAAEAAGFKHLKTVVDCDTDEAECVMRIPRAQLA